MLLLGGAAPRCVDCFIGSRQASKIPVRPPDSACLSLAKARVGQSPGRVRKGPLGRRCQKEVTRALGMEGPRASRAPASPVPVGRCLLWHPLCIMYGLARCALLFQGSF